MLKTGTEFLDSFARLGVFSKVQALMDDDTEAESSVIKSPTDSDVATPTLPPSAAASQPSTSSSASANDESNTKSVYYDYLFLGYFSLDQCGSSKFITLN